MGGGGFDRVLFCSHRFDVGRMMVDCSVIQVNGPCCENYLFVSQGNKKKGNSLL